MALFSKTGVDTQEVVTAVRQHWNLELGKCIKASQNHTFHAEAKDGTKYIVRVTPNLASLQKIVDEVAFVNYVAQSKDLAGQVCPYVAPTAIAQSTDPASFESWVVKTGDLLIVVSEFAKGEMLDLTTHSWMFDQRLIEACGRWLGTFHLASMEFSKAHPLIAARIQRWDQVHDGVLAGLPLERSDRTAQETRDPERYGVLHGDVNCSNFFYTSATATLSVFDWDQVEQGWFMYDLAQPIFTPYLFSRAKGMKVDVQTYTNWLVTGYESARGPHSVNREELHRMLMMRRSLYDRFCRRALQEGDVPKDMKGFLEFVVNWLDREKRELWIKRVLLGGVVVAATLKMFFGRTAKGD